MKLHRLEMRLQKKVKQRLEKSQKEHILREQMQIIKEELGDDFDAETDQLEEKINNLNADDSVKEKLLKELQDINQHG